MINIRQATENDLVRIAEIEVFNYRLNFYPIFKSDEYYFHALQVPSVMERYRDYIDQIFVYDDGVIKGFIWIHDEQIKKLFVEPVLQGGGIGGALLRFAVYQQDANFLWALEKNTRAIAFYSRYGFHLNGERMLEEDTTEHLVKMVH